MKKRIAIITLIASILMSTVVNATEYKTPSFNSLTELKPGGELPQKEQTQKIQKDSVTVDALQKKLKTTKSTVNDSKWDITERDTTIPVELNKGITKFEVVYSADGKIPYLGFRTINGDIYESGNDSENIITRSENQIPGHSDLRYMVIYIIAPSRTDQVKCKISLDSKTSDFMLIRATVPLGWEKFTKEFRTNPEDLILWGTHNSDNTITDLIAIAENTDIKPVEDDIRTAAPPVPEEKDYTGLITSLFVLAIAGGIVLLVYSRYSKENKIKMARASRVSKKNAIAKKHKEANKNSLDSVLNEFKDEYMDDSLFFENTTAGNDINVPIEKKIAFIEEEPVLPTPVEKRPKKEEKKKEDEKIDRLQEIRDEEKKQKEKEVEKVSSTATQPVTKASWM